MIPQTLRSQWPGIVSCNNDSGSVFFKAGMQGKSSDYIVKPSSGGLWIQDHTRWQQQQLLIVVVNFQEQHPRPNHQVFPVDLCRKSASRVESRIFEIGAADSLADLYKTLRLL